MAAFPDLRNTVDEAIHDGRAVAVRSSWTGTHEGGFLGVPPTGRAIGFTALSMNHVADGRVDERWILADVLRVLQRVGDVSWGASAEGRRQQVATRIASGMAHAPMPD